MAKWRTTYYTLLDDRDKRGLGYCDTRYEAFVDFETRSRHFRKDNVYFNEDQSIVLVTGYDRRPELRNRVTRMADPRTFSVTTLDALPQLYSPEGEKVPKAWMGNSCVVVDYEHNRVMYAASSGGKIRYESPDAVPDSNKPFEVHVPDMVKYRRALKDLAGQRTAAVAAYRMSNVVPPRHNESNKYDYIRNGNIYANEGIQWNIGRLSDEQWKEAVRAAFTTHVPMFYLKLHP